jgi:hypothetical protein
VQAGGSALAPRGTAHTFQNFGPASVKMLVLVTPAGFNQFFEELSSLNRGLPAPDLAGAERLVKDYGLEVEGQDHFAESVAANQNKLSSELLAARGLDYPHTVSGTGDGMRSWNAQVLINGESRNNPPIELGRN